MPIEFGSDFTIDTSDYFLTPEPAPLNPISNYFAAPPLVSSYSPTPTTVPSLQVPTTAGGTGSASWFDSAKSFVSGFAAQLPALSQAAVNVRQAYTSSGSRITPVLLPSGYVVNPNTQQGAYTPGYMQQVPGFLTNAGGALKPTGAAFGLSPMVLLAGGLAVLGVILYVGRS